MRNPGNVVFQRLDIVSEELPMGNVGILRQVLQHLTNEDILHFLEQISRKLPYDHLIVTEHIPSGSFSANLDKPAGPNIRVSFNSGVDLALPPFRLKYLESEILCEVPEDNLGFPGIIRTIAYKLK